MAEKPCLGDGVPARLRAGTLDVDKGPFLQLLKQIAQLSPDDLTVPGVARTLERPKMVGMGIPVDRLYLASCSPRRRELLAGLGYSFNVLGASVDETQRAGESPSHYVERMARAKALAGFRLVSRQPTTTGDGLVRSVVVGADTAVVVDGRVLGKPRDEAEILTHLGWLSGRAHDVLSAVAVAYGSTASPQIEIRLCPSRVWFRALAPAECKAYRATGEPLDKAGSYGIQGLAAAFVTRLEGNWSAVVGLPLPDTVELLERAGLLFSDVIGSNNRGGD